MIIYIDMDGVLCDYFGAYQEALKINPDMPYPQSQYGFFAKLKPIPGGVEAMKALMASERYTPYILTAPSMRNPLSYTEKRVWIGEHLGFPFVERLILSPNKGLLKGAFLIDDSSSGKGQDRFEGELIQFGSERFPDWEAVRERLGV